MRKPKPPNIVVVTVMTTITILFWVGFEIYRSFTSQGEPVVNQQILRPVSSQTDLETLEEINQRVYFERGTTQGFSTRIPPTNTAIEDVEDAFPTQTPESTNSAELLDNNSLELSEESGSSGSASVEL